MKQIISLFAMILLLPAMVAYAGYGQVLCKESGYQCLKIKSRQTWASLWPDPYQRDLEKRLNRMNVPLQTGMVIAVPMHDMSLLDAAPFEHQVTNLDQKTIVVAPAVLAWAAYDQNGDLVKWGPISAGKDYCADIDDNCQSQVGEYNVYRKQGPGCISSQFPIEDGGGAPMPYCMFYYRGYALHGSPAVPGYNASHGCIRLFDDDARWLNLTFVGNDSTRVVVLPYDEDPQNAGY